MCIAFELVSIATIATIQWHYGFSSFTVSNQGVTESQRVNIENQMKKDGNRPIEPALLGLTIER